MIDRVWRRLADRWWASAGLDLSRIGRVGWIPVGWDASQRAQEVMLTAGIHVAFTIPLWLDPWPGYERWPGRRLLDLLPVFRAERGGIRFVVPPGTEAVSL